MCEILNEKFQAVFVEDPQFDKAYTSNRINVSQNIKNIKLRKNEIIDLIKGLDRTKTVHDFTVNTTYKIR